MVEIIINNNASYQLEGNLKVITKLYRKFQYKHPQAFYLRRNGSVPKGWNGMIDYITERGYFKAGLLPKVVEAIEELKHEYKITDNRNSFTTIPIIPKNIGEQTLRKHEKASQLEAIKSVIYNKVGGQPYYIGVVDAATNFGKTTIMAGLYLAFKREIPTICLIKDKDLFNQFKKELPKLIPEKDLGFVQGKNSQWGKFTVVMVQTLAPQVKLHINQLAKFGICLVDEADQGGSKSYKNIFNALHNCKVRVGLSGTIYMSKLKKKETEYMNLRSFIGDPLIKVSKKDMVEAGYSTPVVIKVYPGSDKPPRDTYQEEYLHNITQNKKRAKIGAIIMKRQIRFKRTPALVIFKYHEHGELLYKVFKKMIPNKRIEMAHGGTKNRKKLIDEFKDGKIDIFIVSHIFKRGKNSPLIKYIQNHSSGDSQEDVSQIMGRGERTHGSKKKYYLDDFFDEGTYLKRHSKHRLNYYKAEGFKVTLVKNPITIK